MYACRSLTTSLKKKSSKLDTTLGCQYCLKYNVILYSAEKATPGQMARRIYKDDPSNGYKRRQPEDEALGEMKPVWGKLVALNGSTRDEELLGEKTSIGRDIGCDITIDNVFISRKRKSSFLPRIFLFNSFSKYWTCMVLSIYDLYYRLCH